VHRLLVTGGAGFIGCNFVHYWLKEHPGSRVVVLDALTYAGNLANLEPVRDSADLRFVHGNICDTTFVEALLREEQLNTIVHFAAESHVDRSIAGPDAFIETNVVGTHALLKAARATWLGAGGSAEHRFHHISTDEVYGSLGPDDPPFSESTAYAPNSPYSASKAASDHLVRAYHHTYGLKVSVSNCSNNYGPYHFPEKLIPQTIVNLLEGRQIPVYGDGRNVRDWLHVHDHCRGIAQILLQGRVGEVYNIGGRSECENIRLVEQLCAIADQRFAADASLRQRFPASLPALGRAARESVAFVQDRPGHDRRYAIDLGKMERELGFAPLIRLDAGLAATFDWYVSHQHWWQSILAGRS